MRERTMLSESELLRLTSVQVNRTARVLPGAVGATGRLQ